MRFILMMIAVMFAGVTQAAGNWIDTDNNLFYRTGTQSISDKSEWAGYWCLRDGSEDPCSFIYETTIPCTKDAKYSMLFTTESGSGHIETRCAITQDRVSVLYIPITPQLSWLVKALRNDNTLALAVGMRAKYHIATFSLAGSTAAINGVNQRLRNTGVSMY